MTSIWNDVKSLIRNTIPEKSFSLWISPITLLEKKDHGLILGCPNKFSLNWITENYKELIGQKLNELASGEYDFSLKVMSPKRRTQDFAIPEKTPQLSFPQIPGKSRLSLRPLNDEYTFDRFVVGKCNDSPIQHLRPSPMKTLCPMTPSSCCPIPAWARVISLRQPDTPYYRRIRISKFFMLRQKISSMK